MDPEGGPFVHEVAVVVPVYQGERTLDDLVGAILPLTREGRTPNGRAFRVVDVVLVHDHGPDRSDAVIRRLAEGEKVVRAVWLSRNFGQHAATLAGMASTSTDWIVTLDEDGQHDPADIPRLLDTALDGRVPLVYGEATNRAPHGAVRNGASRAARWLANHVMTSGGVGTYSSFRLVVGELGRSVAAYSGHDVYLDVALSWVVSRSATCPVVLHEGAGRPSGYRLPALLAHFVRLVLTSGTRPLRLVAVLGLVASVFGVLLSGYLVYARLVRDITVAGWTSVTVTVLMLCGAILFAVGVVAEYVGVSVRMAMGRPAYVIVRDLEDGPLGHAMPIAAPQNDGVVEAPPRVAAPR